MRRFLFAMLIVFLPQSGFAEDFDDCVLKHAPGENNETKLELIERACLERTTPKRCRRCLPHNARFHDDCNLSEIGKTIFGLEDSSEVDERVRRQWFKQCIKECKEAGIWKRYFGECATG